MIETSSKLKSNYSAEDYSAEEKMQTKQGQLYKAEIDIQTIDTKALNQLFRASHYGDMEPSITRPIDRNHNKAL